MTWGRALIFKLDSAFFVASLFRNVLGLRARHAINSIESAHHV
jgi:hypothetical protein